MDDITRMDVAELAKRMGRQNRRLKASLQQIQTREVRMNYEDMWRFHDRMEILRVILEHALENDGKVDLSPIINNTT